MRRFMLLMCAALAGCGAPALRPEAPAAPLDPSAVVLPVPVEAQREAADCGLACLASLLRHHGLELEEADRRAFPAGTAGIRAGDLRDHLVARGLRAHLVRGTLDEARPAGLLRVLRLGLPALVELALPVGPGTHYVLVTGFDPVNRWLVLMDPAWGAGVVPFDRFDALWARAGRLMLVAAPRAGDAAGGSRACAPAAPASPRR